ncbi:MAG: heme A synthase [Candidatus Omnitrophica bacterium]|nr:heme A synthase [Candidatus Omnitrophota bacterium]
MIISNTFLRRFAKILSVATLFLIFLGALVKSTESGLSVPDWPTTYGHFMFAFPLDQMVGGIKYEHTHRLAASIVGLLALMLCVLLLRSKESSWVKRLGIWAVIAVIGQGILGGLTVKYFLPVWLSALHGVLAQTFFLMTVMIAYGLSVERGIRLPRVQGTCDGKFIRFVVILTGMVYIQLIMGNLMRHTNSGLAIPDFPTMGGSWWPAMDQNMLERINAWRFEHNLEPVKMGQVHIHLTHRVLALLIFLKLIYINQVAYKRCLNNPLIMQTLFWLNIAVFAQIILGIATVVSQKEIITTTLHVSAGAGVLALSFLLILRSSPVQWPEFKKALAQR